MQVELRFVAESAEAKSLRHFINAPKYRTVLKQLIEKIIAASICTEEPSKKLKASNFFVRAGIQGELATYIHRNIVDLIIDADLPNDWMID